LFADESARNARSEAAGDQGQVVPGPDDVAATDLHRVRRERNPALDPERGERARADDPVRGELLVALVPPERLRSLRAEVSVERAVVEAAAREQELEHRDVPAEPAGDERPRAEERVAERAEPHACALADDPVRGEPFLALEGLERGPRLRPHDPVDLAEVEAVRAQCDLQPCELRIDTGICRRGDPQRYRAERQGRRHLKRAKTHGPQGFAPKGLPPSWLTAPGEPRRAGLP
jgi:hypothetical protein